MSEVFGQELSTVDQFEAVLRDGLGAIAITDTARAKPIAHMASGCSWLKRESFVRKVVDGGRRTGRYYWFESMDAAIAAGARDCKRCGAVPAAVEEAFPTAATADVSALGPMPFENYRSAGRAPLGMPSWGDGTSRHGYGVPVFAECGSTCVYCGLELGEPYEAWLNLSVDHVIPAGTVNRLGYPAEWVNDLINLVTACRACNEFLNGYRVRDPAPATIEEFCELRDRHFSAKREWVIARHITERDRYELWKATR